MSASGLATDTAHTDITATATVHTGITATATTIGYGYGDTGITVPIADTGRAVLIVDGAEHRRRMATSRHCWEIAPSQFRFAINNPGSLAMLVANPGRRGVDFQFLAQAWRAAIDKAKSLGWL